MQDNKNLCENPAKVDNKIIILLRFKTNVFHPKKGSSLSDKNIRDARGTPQIT
jgi:hypothetical protein